MFRSQIFSKALQIRKKIAYDVKGEPAVVTRVVYPAWVELVDKFTMGEYSSYDLEVMLSEYAKGNINLSWIYKPISATYGDVKFVSTRIIPVEAKTAAWRVQTDRSLWHKAFLKDEVVYDSASLWLHYYKDELVSYDLLLQNGSTAYRLGNGNPERVSAIYYVCLLFLKFAVEELSLTELYRIHPKPPGWEDTFSFTCINEKGATLKTREHPCIVEDLGDNIFKYRHTKEIIDELSESDIRSLYPPE